MIRWLKQFMMPLRRSFWQERKELKLQRRRMLGFYAQFLQKGSLCFDVGANIGNRTAVFRELGATVVAIEPQESCMKELHKKFRRNPDVRLVEKALGEHPGEQELILSNASTISSMSREWIERVRSSGRFASYQWDRVIRVPVTTLDELIREHGVPDFIKIDVEGFEHQVLKGLHRPAKVISFEFVPEAIDEATKCLEHLVSLGSITGNYSLGESMEFALTNWLAPDGLIRVLTALPNKSVFGDIYVRFA